LFGLLDHALLAVGERYRQNGHRWRRQRATEQATEKDAGKNHRNGPATGRKSAEQMARHGRKALSAEDSKNSAPMMAAQCGESKA
jgi:hypothetical protein